MTNITIEYENDTVYLDDEIYTIFTDKERVIGRTPLWTAKFISNMTAIEDVLVMDEENNFRCVSDKDHMNYLEVFNSYKVLQCGVEFTTKDLILIIEKAVEKKDDKKGEKKPIKKENK